MIDPTGLDKQAISRVICYWTLQGCKRTVIQQDLESNLQIPALRKHDAAA